jgi:hypothetical protein
MNANQLEAISRTQCHAARVYGEYANHIAAVVVADVLANLADCQEAYPGLDVADIVERLTADVLDTAAAN